MHKSFVLLSCLTVVAVSGFASMARADNMPYGNNTTTTTITTAKTSDYGNTINSGSTVYTGAGSEEYIVNPTEMTSTRDNRGSIPEGVRPSNVRYYRTHDNGNGANVGNPNWDNTGTMNGGNTTYNSTH